VSSSRTACSSPPLAARTPRPGSNRGAALERPAGPPIGQGPRGCWEVWGTAKRSRTPSNPSRLDDLLRHRRLVIVAYLPPGVRSTGRRPAAAGVSGPGMRRRRPAVGRPFQAVTTARRAVLREQLVRRGETWQMFKYQLLIASIARRSWSRCSTPGSSRRRGQLLAAVAGLPARRTGAAARGHRLAGNGSRRPTNCCCRLPGPGRLVPSHRRPGRHERALIASSRRPRSGS